MEEKHSEGFETEALSKVVDPIKSRSGNDIAGPVWMLRALGTSDTAKAMNKCLENQKTFRGMKRREMGEENGAEPVWPSSSVVHKAHLHLYCVVPGDASHNLPDFAGVLTAAIFLSDQLRQSRTETIPQISRTYSLPVREPITSSKRRHGWQPMPDWWCWLG